MKCEASADSNADEKFQTGFESRSRLAELRVEPIYLAICVPWQNSIPGANNFMCHPPMRRSGPVV